MSLIAASSTAASAAAPIFPAAKSSRAVSSAVGRNIDPT
jgi:hypothetical protein